MINITIYLELIFTIILIFLPIGISIIFFITNKLQKNILFQLFSSIHGLFEVIVFIGAIALFENGVFSNLFYEIIYNILYIIPILSIFSSFYWYKENSNFFYLNIINVLYLLLFLLYGLLFFIIVD